MQHQNVIITKEATDFKAKSFWNARCELDRLCSGWSIFIDLL